MESEEKIREALTKFESDFQAKNKVIFEAFGGDMIPISLALKFVSFWVGRHVLGDIALGQCLWFCQIHKRTYASVDGVGCDICQSEKTEKEGD